MLSPNVGIVKVTLDGCDVGSDVVCYVLEGATMRFVMEVELDNDAFQDGQYELSYILNKITESVDADYLYDSRNQLHRILDSNGNTVGFYMIRDDDG